MASDGSSSSEASDSESDSSSSSSGDSSASSGSSSECESDDEEKVDKNGKDIVKKQEDEANNLPISNGTTLTDSGAAQNESKPKTPVGELMLQLMGISHEPSICFRIKSGILILYPHPLFQTNLCQEQPALVVMATINATK